MDCPECGKKLSDTATFCSGCGWKSEAWTESTKKTDATNESRWAAIIVCFIILLLLAIVFINTLREVL